MNHSRHFRTALVGFGPAGLAVLLSANRDGKLRALLEDSLLVLERGTSLGSGTIGKYSIDSDSTGTTFLDALSRGPEKSLHSLLDTTLGRRIAEAGSRAIPLSDAGRLLGLIGNEVRRIVKQYPQSEICTGWTVRKAQRTGNDQWLLTAESTDGMEQIFTADQIILATGAHQPTQRLETEFVAGYPLHRWSDRLIQSDEVLGPGGLAHVTELLKEKRSPKVAVVGGSASAMAVCHALLNRLPEVCFGAEGVTLVHRRPLRLYYTSKQAALEDGYTDFRDEDLCRLTQRVYRLAGLRLDSRELLMRLLRVGGMSGEPRMRMHRLRDQDPKAAQILDEADLVIVAFGYRPKGLPLLSWDGKQIPLFSERGPASPLVDDLCRVLDSDGTPIPNVFGIGLAAGFVPKGKLGGEPSFSGQANGLWLWQTDVGAIVVNQLITQLDPPSTTFEHLADDVHALHS